MLHVKTRDKIGAHETAANDMSSLGDRRARVRFEVVGALRGMLELPARARLLNISRTGALIESPLAFPLESSQVVYFSLAGGEVAVETRVQACSAYAQSKTDTSILWASSSSRCHPPCSTQSSNWRSGPGLAPRAKSPFHPLSPEIA